MVCGCRAWSAYASPRGYAPPTLVGSHVYDFIYRSGAPWEVGPRSELVGLVESKRLDPSTHPRVVDLGCGTGANVVFLAEHGFEATGVDFSRVALAKAQRLAVEHGVADNVRWFRGDLTRPKAAPAETFDVFIDYWTLDDLRAAGRERMAALIGRLSRPGSLFLLWCFFGSRSEMPWISFDGPSKLVPAIRPGEVEDRFGGRFDIERLPEPPRGSRSACFLMTRRADDQGA